MGDPRLGSDGDGAPRAADGRVAGRRGQATRQRLLDATRDAIGDGPYRDLTVVDISRRAETSTATFYQYFPDIESALLSLLDELTDSGGQRLRTLVTDASWDGDSAAKGLAAYLFCVLVLKNDGSVAIDDGSVVGVVADAARKCDALTITSEAHEILWGM